MQVCRVKRRNRRDLVFEGEMVACASEKEQDGGLSTWMDLALYKTCVGKYVLSSNLHCESPDDGELCAALSFASADDIHEFVRSEKLAHMGVVHLLLDRAKDRGV